MRPCPQWARNTAVRRNKAAYDENADRCDRDRVAVKDGARRLRSQPARRLARAAASGVGVLCGGGGMPL